MMRKGKRFLSVHFEGWWSLFHIQHTTFQK
jgi:hypothetical protein